MTNNKTIWKITTGIPISLNRELTRQVFTEKFNLKKAKQIEMKNLFISKINGCQIFKGVNTKPTNDSDLTLYVNVKSNKIMLAVDESKNHFFIRTADFWDAYISIYGLWDSFIHILMLEWIEELLPLSMPTPTDGRVHRVFKISMPHIEVLEEELLESENTIQQINQQDLKSQLALFPSVLKIANKD